jgi:hypothetical protein
MKRLLHEHLTPDDDGRAFTEAVLLRASGALHRRRAAQAAAGPVVDWLQRWARPWVLAALVGAAVAVFATPRATGPDAPRAGNAVALDAVAALLPEDVAAAMTDGN